MRKITSFRETLKKVRRRNIEALKRKAFGANRLAKQTSDTSQVVCYRIKNAAISQLLLTGAAAVNSCSLYPTIEIAVDFVGGGRLHAKLSHLTVEVRRVVRQQLDSSFGLTDQESQITSFGFRQSESIPA